MQNRTKRILIFLFYTLLIFHSYLFVILPFAIYVGYDWLRIRFLVKAFCPVLIIPSIIGYEIFVDIPRIIIKYELKDMIAELLKVIILFGIPIGISCLFIYWWFKKQCVLTAWGIAFIGSCYACIIYPSTMALGDGDHQGGFSWIALPVVNAFYCLLCIADLFQRQLWPDNKFAIRLRYLLSLPCLNPNNSMETLSDHNTKNLEHFK